MNLVDNDNVIELEKFYLLFLDLDDDVHTDDNREGELDGNHSIHSTDSESETRPVEDVEETPPVETPYIANGIEEFGLVRNVFL